MIRTRILPIVLAVLMSLVYGCADDVARKVAADPWEEYLAFSERYFYLDKQDFGSITCSLDIPLMNETVGQVRQLVVQSGGAVVVEENISEFSVTYEPGVGTDFFFPELRVNIVSEEGLENIEALKAGIPLIEQGVEMQIQGAAMSIDGIIDEMLAPDREAVVLERFERKGGKTYVEYASGDLKVREVYGNRVVEAVEEAPDSVAESVEHYEKDADGKLRLSGASAKVTQNDTVIEFDLTIGYQEVDGVVFFKNIVTDLVLQMSGVKQETHIEYYFKDCTVKK